MAKKAHAYAFAEYPEASPSIRLLDGRERRIRLTLATLRRFETMPLVEPGSTLLNYEQIAAFIWAVLIDKDELTGPADILELVTAPLLAEIMLAIQDTAASDGNALKNGLRRVTERGAAPGGSSSTLLDGSSSGSPLTNSGPIPLPNSPHS